MRDSLYENLYSKFVNEIRSGKLGAGSKMPSVRQCAEESGVSRNTVLGAYSILLSEGYINARERSGYYVARFDAPLPAGIPEVKRTPQRKTEAKEYVEQDAG